MSYKRFLVVSALMLGVCFKLASCVDASHHSQNLHSAQERQMTVGVVQREIYRGMSQASVAQALGSPNIVSSENSKEVWIYDKIASEASYSRSSGSLGGLGGARGVGGTTLLIGIGAGAYSKEAGAASSTQRTLTVVIRFDEERLVEDFSYHASRF
jgi:outer membrane protein assembly factor BamE (lipoprotein component of BamABCDE complex)